MQALHLSMLSENYFWIVADLVRIIGHGGLVVDLLDRLCRG